MQLRPVNFCIKLHEKNYLLFVMDWNMYDSPNDYELTSRNWKLSAWNSAKPCLFKHIQTSWNLPAWHYCWMHFVSSEFREILLTLQKLDFKKEFVSYNTKDFLLEMVIILQITTSHRRSLPSSCQEILSLVKWIEILRNPAC